MSLKAMSWALDDVEGLHPTRKLVLLIMAEAASADGTGSFLGQHTIARKAGISVRQVRDHIKALHIDGYIEHGDQRYVQHIPANYQPTVWNMLMTNTKRLQAITKTVGQSIPSARHTVNKTGRKPTAALDSNDSGGKSTAALGRKSSVVQGGSQGGSPLPTNQEPEEEPSSAAAAPAPGRSSAAAAPAPGRSSAAAGDVYIDRHGLAHTGMAAWRAQKADRRALEAEKTGHPADGEIGRLRPTYPSGDHNPSMTTGLSK